MLHLSAACRYYLYSGSTDMRKGFDSLCGIITSQMNLNALSGAVFIFFNKFTLLKERMFFCAG